MLDYKTDLFVLKERDYGDFDRIVTVYMRDFGKKNIKIRGAYKILSKLNPHVQLFSIINSDIASGRGFDYVCNANKDKVYSNIILNFKKSIVYLFVLEVIDKLTQDNFKDIEIYDLCLRYFEYLDKLEVNNENKDFFISFKEDQDLIESLYKFFVLFLETNGLNIEKKYHLKNDVVSSKESFFDFIYFYVEKFLNVQKFFK